MKKIVTKKSKPVVRVSRPSNSSSRSKSVLHKPVSSVMSIAAIGTSIAVFLFFLWVLISIRNASTAQEGTMSYEAPSANYGTSTTQ